MMSDLYDLFYGDAPLACREPPLDDRVVDKYVLNIAYKLLRRGSFCTGYILAIRSCIALFSALKIASQHGDTQWNLFE